MDSPQSNASPQSSTTLDASPPSHTRYGDQPVQLEAFHQNISACKAVLTASLPVNAIVQVAWVALAWNSEGDEGDESVRLLRRVVDVVVAMSSAIALFIYFLSLRPSIRQSNDLALFNPSISYHTIPCSTLTTIPFISLIILPLPYILTVLHAQNPTKFTPSIIQDRHWTEGFSALRVGLLCAAFFSAGLMRRGPRLFYQPVSLESGNGTGPLANVKIDTTKPYKAPISGEPRGLAMPAMGKLNENRKDVEPEPNVLDYENCSVLSAFFIGFTYPLARRSMAVQQLHPSDLPYLPYNRRAERITTLSKIRMQEDESRKAKSGQSKEDSERISNRELLMLLWRGNGAVIISLVFIDWFGVILTFVSPYCLHEIINAFKAREEGHRDDRYAYLMCIGLFVGAAGDAVLSSYLNIRENYRLHVPIRMTLSELLFRKILRARDAKSTESSQVSNTGGQGKGRSQVMNLLTIDTNTIASLATKIYNFTNSSLSLTIGVIFLYSLLGWSAFVGIAVLPAFAPCSFLIAKAIYRCDRQLAVARDRRVGAVKEFLLGIKVIKLNAWEEDFQRRIRTLRDEEVRLMRWRYWLGTAFNIVADQVPLLAILAMFATFVLFQKRTLDPATAFVAFTIFNMVKQSLGALPQAVNHFFESLVSLNRLTAYLSSPEIDLPNTKELYVDIELTAATITWAAPHIDEVVQEHTPFRLSSLPKVDNTTSEHALFRLTDLTFSLPRGKLSLCIGPLGSGKTLFLLGLLGEAYIEGGSVHAPRSFPYAIPPPEDLYDASILTTDEWLNNSVAYAPQQAFIQTGSIRSNIIFGQPFWPERYWETLRQVSLLADLAIMVDGDLTELGEQGVQCSGGQRARINLARCVYSRASTIYLDDILSAVDSHTAKWIVKECLQGPLLKDRTVVLVTHQVSLCLPVADFIVELNNGTVRQACSSTSVVDLPGLLFDVGEEDVKDGNEMEDLESPEGNANNAASEAEPLRIVRQVYDVEARAIGRVASTHYWMVFRAAGGLSYWLIFAIIFLGTQAFSVGEGVWVRRWTSDGDPLHMPYYLGIYALIVWAGIVTGAFRWIWLYGVGDGKSSRTVGFSNSGCRKIHSMLLSNLSLAPLTFFENTPSARVLNRFAGDMFCIDGRVSDDVGRSVMAALTLLSSVLVVAVDSPPFIIVLGVAMLPFKYMADFFFKLRADLRRLSSTSSSPLIQTYNDAISAIIVVRAFGACSRIESAFKVYIDRERLTNTSDFIVWNWFRLSIYLVASLLVTATGLLVLSKDMSAAQAGFTLSFALLASSGLFGLLEQFSNLEQAFVAAERIHEYCQVPHEVETIGEPLSVPADWPTAGKVEVKKLHVRYANDLPDVLKGVSFTVEAGHRVGIVGATGSGKTTLALSLFRATEAYSGRIEIDGIDIAHVPIRTLRHRLNMIVQESNLCSGTLREALDITQTIDDYELFEALKKVHLLSSEPEDETQEKNVFADLDSFVAVEGGNFSHGQRQLLCLARALLKKSKILVMDEATSSVDYETDAKITATIEESFKGVTLLVIAHRLATICGFDRVLVVDAGRIVEYGPPSELILDENSAFHRLCVANGPEEFEKLLALIRNS